MLPQGMFSVAVATVLFPQLARLAARGDYAGLQATIGVGLRQIALLLIPAGAAMLVLAEPMVRLVYERGEFDAESTAADRRGAVLVRVQPPVQRLRADAHARVLLAPAPVGADDAGRRLAGDQRDRLLPAGRAAAGSAASCSARSLSNAALVIAEAIWLRRALAASRRAGRCSRSRRCCSARRSLARRRLRRLVGARRRCSGARCSAQIVSRRHRAGRRRRGLRGRRPGPADPRGAADPRPFRSTAPPALVT